MQELEKVSNHAGEQENKKLKIQSGLIVICSKKAAGTISTLSRVVSEIEKELRKISHSQKKETKILHSLNQNKININSKNIIGIAVTCDTAKF